MLPLILCACLLTGAPGIAAAQPAPNQPAPNQPVSTEPAAQPPVAQQEPAIMEPPPAAPLPTQPGTGQPSEQPEAARGAQPATQGPAATGQSSSATPQQAPLATLAVQDPMPPVKQNNVHAIGLAGSFATGSGLTYRRYFGDTALQLAFLGWVTTNAPTTPRKIDSALVFIGASVAQYVKVWHTLTPRGLLPSTTALRLTGGAHYFFHRQNTQSSQFQNGVWSTTSTLDTASSVNLGAGLGFEFGGIVRQGFSLALDVVLTVAIDNQGIDYVLPLPQGAIVYNW